MLPFSCCSKTAHVENGQKITVKNAWVRAVPPVAKTSAAYLMIQNHSMKEDWLIAVESSISGTAELHNVTQNGNIMTRGPVGQISVPAHGTAELAPGGSHAMLFQLKSVPK